VSEHEGHSGSPFCRPPEILEARAYVGTVPVGSEVVVVKPGAFGEQWQMGYRAG
jgi:hypothetical protein